MLFVQLSDFVGTREFLQLFVRFYRNLLICLTKTNIIDIVQIATTRDRVSRVYTPITVV